MKLIPVNKIPSPTITSHTHPTWRDLTNANTMTVIRSSPLASHSVVTFQHMLLLSNTFAWSATKSSPLVSTWKSTPTFTLGRSPSSALTKGATRPSDKRENSLCTRNFTRTRSSLFRRWSAAVLLYRMKKVAARAFTRPLWQLLLALDATKFVQREPSLWWWRLTVKSLFPLTRHQWNSSITLSAHRLWSMWDFLRSPACFPSHLRCRSQWSYLQ